MPKINPRIKSIDDLLGVTQATGAGVEAASKSVPDKNNEIQMLSHKLFAASGIIRSGCMRATGSMIW